MDFKSESIDPDEVDSRISRECLTLLRSPLGQSTKSRAGGSSSPAPEFPRAPSGSGHASGWEFSAHLSVPSASTHIDIEWLSTQFLGYGGYKT